MKRRAFASVSIAALLVGCGLTGPAATPWDMARAYLDAGIAATLAAAQQYAAGVPTPSSANLTMVIAITSALERLKTALDAVTTPADWKSGATQAEEFLRQLVPIVGTYLGPAAQYIPLVMAVVSAFLNALPPPPDAPPAPPAALVRKSLEYHGHAGRHQT